MNNKLLTIRAGENVVRILPPLNVKKNEIDLAMKIIKGKYTYDPPMIDWLNLIKNNNDLHLFFD